MKVNSRFAKKCPGCGRVLPKNTWTGEVDDPWGCLKCADPVCACCYADHTAKCCPDLNVNP